MTGYITTGSGKSIATEYRIVIDGNDLVIVFNFKWDLSIAWDIDEISLRYKSGLIEIITVRGSELPEDGLIGAQLMSLASPLLKQALFEKLNNTEQTQVREFATDAFKKISVFILPELSTYKLIQSYKDVNYIVSFEKYPQNATYDVVWQIVNVEKESL